uniref:Uncharacterized protein n=1 Tax=Rhizophora mucronata TaxID=61149 RepID=A0A2P2NGN2_RHIMU
MKIHLLVSIANNLKLNNWIKIRLWNKR